MAARTFVDTNVFVYLHDAAEPARQAAAAARLSRARSDGTELVVSTQVLLELHAVLTRGRVPMADATRADRAVREVARFEVVSADAALVLAGIALARAHRLSVWDAMIVAAARAARCDVLLTEDLGDGRSYDGVRVENPFRDLRR